MQTSEKFQIPNLPELVFEERRHLYQLNGMTIPSVTTLMQPLSDDVYGGIDNEVLSKAASRGTAVHTAIENYIKFGIEDIDPGFSGYFEGFLKWFKDHSVEAYGNEVRLYHKTLLYAGTADMFANVDGKDTLIDFKTSAAVSIMLCGVQLEAYERAYASHIKCEPFQKAILHLKKDGEYQMIPFEAVDMECWRVFTALLTVRNYKAKFKH